MGERWENDKSAGEWEDFKGLTLTGPSRRAGPNGSPYRPSFSPSSSKQAQRTRPEPHGLNPSRPIFSRPKAQESGCTHCGGNKHTKDTCFQLHGYPEWWYELKEKKGVQNGHATFVSNTNPNTLVPLDSQPHSLTHDPSIFGSTNLVSNGEHKNDWIIDSGATDHMTYEYKDFKIKLVPQQKVISGNRGRNSGIINHIHSP